MGMKVQIKLIATYREYLPPECKGKIELEIPANTTPFALLAQFGVPLDESVVLVDGASPKPDQILEDGNVVFAFSATAGG
ncbi:MAG: hypothetical protein KAG66_19175 [Methylococcales bacterium]|nr:hypothetical protein [Methylococcales bacterium]